MTPQKPVYAPKCLLCPYWQGKIKCVISPCRECLLKKYKTHPFRHINDIKK